jgi:hypothetical protein
VTLIQKFHDICLSYYFKMYLTVVTVYSTILEFKKSYWQLSKLLTSIIVLYRSNPPYSNAKDMRVTQDLNSFGEIIAHAQLMKKNKNIFRVYHIRIITKRNWFTRHETDRLLNNHCQECVRAYLSIHDCLLFIVLTIVVETD